MIDGNYKEVAINIGFLIVSMGLDYAGNYAALKGSRLAAERISNNSVWGRQIFRQSQIFLIRKTVSNELISIVPLQPLSNRIDCPLSNRIDCPTGF
uniref:Uncharacterized protein n=1 Tax=Romanomermis culicivorax TaxID=13658 RepID=A0A915J2A0_ROMCU